MNEPSLDSKEWFTEYLLPHEPMLRAWLKSHFGDRIDEHDVLQEAYFRVLRTYREKPIRAPKAFLFATARNIALNAMRASSVRGERYSVSLDDFDIIDDEEDFREKITRNQELEKLTEAIQSLPRRCRQIFTLCKVYGMTPNEIAKELDMSVQTIYTQLAIGLNKCTQFMKRERNLDLP